MSSTEHDESDESGSISAVERPSGFGSAMSDCLRAQAMQDPRSRVATFFGASPLSPEANKHYSDAVSELETTVALAALGSAWLVAHSTESGADQPAADHLVLGPSGIFLVGSRAHPHAKIFTAGRMILVNGRRVAYVRDAISNADRLTADLKRFGAVDTSVRPVVVFGGASSVHHGRMRAPVPVLQLGELVRWILRQPKIYSATEVERLVAIAGRLGSWQVRPDARNASVRLTARFERLRTEVDIARQRYRLWVVAGGTIALAATVIMLVVAAPAIADLLAA